MRAPVYRNIEQRNTFLGLAFPGELLLVLSVFWGGVLLLPPALALAITIGAYALLRVAGYGRPPMFLQHYVVWQLRQAVSAGRLSAAARAHQCPRFPYARYEYRDQPSLAPAQISTTHPSPTPTQSTSTPSQTDCRPPTTENPFHD